METTIHIDGMTCNGCVRSVTNVLSALPSASTVSVDLTAAQARLQFDPAVLTVEQIKAAINDAGFDAR